MHIQDIEIGALLESEPFELDLKQMIEFAKIWDPRPIHIDPDAAASSPFGGIIASTAFVWAVYSKLAVQITEKYQFEGFIAGLGQEQKLVRPARPGDFLTLRMRAIERRISERDPSRFVVTASECLFNQEDELVFDVKAYTLGQVKDPRAS
jgi:acyl dehydratase